MNSHNNTSQGAVVSKTEHFKDDSTRHKGKDKASYSDDTSSP